MPKPLGLLLVLLALPTAAQAQMTGPAPDGDPPIVAERIIQKQGFEDCPFVARAWRFGDGSIAARCSNGEWFKVFWFKPVGYTAMRSPPMDRLVK
jgi:hypothetical protein